MSISNRFNLNSFLSEFNNNGIVTPNRYLVSFSPFKNFNSYLQDTLIKVNDKLTLRCDTAVLPSTSLLNADIRRYGYGPIEKSPHSIQFTNLNLSWIIDRNGDIVKFFNHWKDSIINHSSKGGADMQTKKRGMSPYEVGYKDDYTCPEVTIVVYDTEDNTVIKYRIYDVYPTIVEDIPLNWDTKNSVIKLSVQFFFTDMESETIADTQEYINIFENIPRGLSNQDFSNIDQSPILNTVII